MNEFVRQIRNKLLSAWEYRWFGIGVAWLLVVLSVIGVSIFREKYEASARIHVDTQTVLKPLMKELAAQPDIDQQVRMLARTLITRPTVEKIIKEGKYDYPMDTAADRELVMEILLGSIRMNATGGNGPDGRGGNVYTLSFRDPDPKRAKKFVEDLLAHFVGSSTGTSKNDAAAAMQFINQQIADYEAKLSESETRLKDFKVKHFGVSGATQQDFFSRMATLSDEVNKLRTDYNAAVRSRDSLRSALATEPPQLPMEALPQLQGPAQMAPSETAMRLEGARRNLDDLLRRFTDIHPDVVAARVLVSDLEARKRVEDDEARRRTATRGSAVPNPVYQQLKMQITNADAQVASLGSQLSTQQARLDQVRAQAGKVPEIEAEHAQLNRDYEVVRTAYQKLVEKRESAQLGAKLDEGSKLADFRVVDPPTVTATPIFPNRLSLAFLCSLASIILGVATAVGMAIAFPTVTDEQELLQLTKRPVLGGVSIAMDGASQSAARWQKLQFVGTVLIFLASAVTWVVWIFFSSRSV